MCNACGFFCCAHDGFARCGCDGCPNPECWDDDGDFTCEELEDEFDLELERQDRETGL